MISLAAEPFPAVPGAPVCVTARWRGVDPFVSTARLINVCTVLNEHLDGSRASEAHGVVKRRYAVLVGGVNVRPAFERIQKPLPLICGLRIALATNGKEFVFHLFVSY